MRRRKKSIAVIEALEGRLLLSGTGEITGVVYVDYNGNGVRDRNEPPASQVTVYASYSDTLDRNPFQTVTDSNGHYTLTGLPATSYDVDAFPKNQTQGGEQYFITVVVMAGKVAKASPMGVVDLSPLALNSPDQPAFPIVRLDASVGSTDIVLGGDRNFYSNAPGHNAVLQISPSGGVKELPIPTPNADIGPLAIGGNQNIWFTEPGANSVGSVSTAGTFNPSIIIPTPNSDPAGIAEGDNGNIWFTERSGNKIGTIISGSVLEYPIPTANSQPTAIAKGDLSVWFIESNADKIGELYWPHGWITEHPISAAQGSPKRILQGPDGNMWFTLDNPAGIGVITNAGNVTVYPITTRGSAPLGISDGPNGTLAFTDPGTNAWGEITTTGQITEFPISTASSQPDGLAMDSDSSMWLVESDVPAIAVARHIPAPITQTLSKPERVNLFDFTDPDPAGRRSQYIVTINWGDSRRIVSGTIKKKSSGVFSVIGKHRFKAAGTYTVSVTILDLAGSTLKQSVTATVTS